MGVRPGWLLAVRSLSLVLISVNTNSKARRSCDGSVEKIVVNDGDVDVPGFEVLSPDRCARWIGHSPMETRGSEDTEAIPSWSTAGSKKASAWFAQADE